MTRCFCCIMTMVMMVTMVAMVTMIDLARECGWAIGFDGVGSKFDLAMMRTREGRGWWGSVAWGVRVIARDARVRVVVVGDGEDVVARRRHVRVCRRRIVGGNRCAQVSRLVGKCRVGHASDRARCACPGGGRGRWGGRRRLSSPCAGATTPNGWRERVCAAGVACYLSHSRGSRGLSAHVREVARGG